MFCLCSSGTHGACPDAGGGCYLQYTTRARATENKAHLLVSCTYEALFSERSRTNISISFFVDYVDTTCPLIENKPIVVRAVVPGGLVGGPRAYQDQFPGFKSHRVHKLVGAFSFIKKMISGKRKSVSY